MPLDFRQLAERSQELALLGRRHFAKDMGFLHREFKERDRTAILEDNLEAALSRELAARAESDPEEATQVSARDYLKQWCDAGGYLIKKRAASGDAFAFRLTSASERVIRFVTQAGDQRASGLTTTEAGFHAILGAVKELTLRTETREERLKILQAQRAEIDDEIGDLLNGIVRKLQPGQIRDRLIKTRRDIEDFLSDFRFIEEQFQIEAERLRDTLIRENISKGSALADHLSAEEHLRKTDQGRTYFEFDRFIGSHDGRELLLVLEEKMPALAREHGIPPDDFEHFRDRIRAERAVIRDTHSRLSRTLRDLVESGRSRELRRLHEEISRVKQEARRLRETPPDGDILTLDGRVEWNNAMTLGYDVSEKSSEITRPTMPNGNTANAGDALIASVPKPIDLIRLRKRITKALHTRDQISLEMLLQLHPAESIAEIAGYIVIAGEASRHLIDKEKIVGIRFPASASRGLLLRLPRIIYFPSDTSHRPQTDGPQ